MLFISIAILVIVVVALVFDFINGFHDAANSIATVVATKVLRPFQAVIWAAFWNFIAAFFFGTHVANTIAKDVINQKYILSHDGIWVIFAALVGAIIWDVITWYFGLPASSSHALIGGLAGAALMNARSTDALIFSGLSKVTLFIVLSPTIGMILGFTLMVAVYWIFHKTPPGKIDKWFRRLQLVSAGAYSLGHGLNDAQKTIGLITMVLIANNQIAPTGHPPYWVEVTSYTIIGLGTMLGGWKVIRTLGMRMTKLTPFGGFSAETSASLTIFLASALGIPVSTTQTISGAIAGVGAAKSTRAVRWKVARNIMWAWILTIPLSATFGMIAYKLLTLLNLS
jgi:PiT family inorganic phosphate transporter